MRVLGIDPGFATVGFGVLDYVDDKFKVVDCGVVTTKAGGDLCMRLKLVYDGVMDLVQLNCPDVVAIEKLFFNTNAKTVINVAQARGVLVLAAANSGVSVVEYTPLQIKQAVVGYGNAEKRQVQHMVKVLLNLDVIPKPDDAADALAVAICAAHSTCNTVIC